MLTVRSAALSCVATLALLSMVAVAQEPKPKPAVVDPFGAPDANARQPVLPATRQPMARRKLNIEEVLQQQASLDFVETPLKDVVIYLQEAHGVPIALNAKALEEANISVDTPLTKNLKGIRLETALRLLLRELGLVFDATDEMLEITTPKDLATRRPVRVVADPFGPDVVADPFGPDDATARQPVLPATRQPTARRKLNIEEVLQQQASLDFVETPLKDVIIFLREVHGIPIALNAKALEEANIPVDTPITKNLRAIRLETALGLLLRELGLVFDATDEMLEITTPKDLATRPQVRVYDCRDLLALGPAGQVVEGAIAGGEGGPFGDTSSAESLKQTISRSVDAPSWNTAEGGGTIENFKGLLIVSHHSQAHRQIERLLNTLRETAGLEARAGKPIR